MTLIDIVLIFVVIGLVMWLINAYIPMAGGDQEPAQCCGVFGRTDLGSARLRNGRRYTRRPYSQTDVIFPPWTFLAR